MQKLKEIPRESRITRQVRLWANREGEDYPTGWRGPLTEVAEHGCQSGIVDELIYYSDTSAFFAKHIDEISLMLSDAICDAGGTISDLLPAWDNLDPLARDANNRNLLAWWAFERRAAELLDAAEQTREAA